jgi:hypothetical protein
MAALANFAALNALALVASQLPSLNPPIPVYAVIMSDSFIPLTVPSSWLEFSPKYETQMSDYPQEQGAFQPYNKVARPITVDVSMAKTGSDLARFAWLAAIQQMEAQNPTQLYTLVSPQGIYDQYAIGGMSYQTRQDRGSNMLYLTIQFVQIPQIASSTGTYDNVLESKSSPIAQLGRIYTQAASLAQTALINAQNFILS